MSKKVGRGRKRLNPVKAGGKYSISLPDYFNEDKLKILETMADNEKGGLNAAFLFFLNIGLDSYIRSNSENRQQLKLNLDGLSDAAKQNIVKWSSQPSSQKALELVLMFLVGGENKLNLFSDLISENKPLIEAISENKSEIKVNNFAKKLINTGFS